MINKIVSIASFVLAIISGILSFGFLAFSGFSPGLQMYEATPIFSFLIGAIIFILGGIFIWKGKTWAKILVGLATLGLLTFQLLFHIFGRSSVTGDIILTGFFVIVILLTLFSFKKR